MKTFIKKTIFFLSIAVLLVLAISIGAYYIVKSQSSFKIDKNITKLVVGHSHSEHSVNDSILKNSLNLSASGESYFYNYQKLRKVVSANKHINTVFIEFTNNHVDSVMDEWIWGYDQMSFRLQYYGPFMDPEDFKILLKHNPTDLLSSYSVATRKYLYRIIGGDYYLIDEIGGYAYSKRSKVDEIIANNKFNVSISENHSLSEINLNYLRKMIEYCRERNIKVFLIRSPFHPLYDALSNEAVYQNVLKTQFSDVDLLDFSTMDFPNNNYLDLQHLNYKGAKKFTTLFNDLIENNILNSDHKQSLIDDRIKESNKK
ncbi:hypothetical protein LX77_00031 [Gelidibacter algens]|uniref:SGNH/GDSL hydrolase family protein n=1 Tax=Gelidibacter algens TaxID=49280 RepID=A0A327SEG6_9FLAO|nr:hypothetical protein [Gelidibacter algens]RAJ27459.1 hypothetical protein LX77_00031 [Gelidibacter algens]